MIEPNIQSQTVTVWDFCLGLYMYLYIYLYLFGAHASEGTDFQAVRDVGRVDAFTPSRSPPGGRRIWEEMGGGPVARASQPCTSEPHSTGRGQSALAGQPLSPLSLPASP